MDFTREQLDAKIAELRDRGYGERFSITVNRKRLSLEEAAREELATAERRAANFRDMIASRSAPGLKTDTSFTFERRRLGDQLTGMDADVLKALERDARRKGRSLNANSYYDPGLAAYVGDSTACVPFHESRSHIAAVNKARNLTNLGPVPHEAEQRDPPKHLQKQRRGKRLASDLADSVAKRLMKADPKLALASKSEQRQEAAKVCGYD